MRCGICGRRDVPKGELLDHDCPHGKACCRCRSCASRLAKKSKNAWTREFWQAVVAVLEAEDE